MRVGKGNTRLQSEASSSKEEYAPPRLGNLPTLIGFPKKTPGQYHLNDANGSNSSRKDGRMWMLITLSCNDPSAGSPTETLLRLLLPLDDQV